MTLRRVALSAVAAIALIALLVIAVPTIIDRFDFFRVAAIEFEGLSYLDPADVLPRLEVPNQAHILVDLAPIEARARAIPGIREARVTRRWPGTLVVRLWETTPVALVPIKGQLMVMDLFGRVLPWPPGKIGHSLPLAPHDSSVAGLLARLQAADPLGYQNLDRVLADGTDLWLEVGARRIRVLATAGSGLLRNVARVREWLADSGLAWREIDARIPNRFFVLKESM